MKTTNWSNIGFYPRKNAPRKTFTTIPNGRVQKPRLRKRGAR